MLNYIYDKNIWITGASSGIGLELATILSKTKCNLLLSARNSEKLIKVASSISGNAKVFAFPLDVSDTNAVNDTFEFIIGEVGFPNILINNAGVYIDKPFIDTTIDEFDFMINTNLKGYFNTTRAVLPSMIEFKGGAIVNIVSLTAIETFNNCAVYSASKSAVLSMMNCIREEVREHNIKIINIIPGAVATTIWSDAILNKHRHKMSSPRDIAEVVVNTLQLSASDTSMIENIVIKPQHPIF